MGYQYDKGMREGFDAEWQLWYDGTQRRCALGCTSSQPSHIVIIYNDHMNYFDLKTYPTFAIGMAAHFPQADEGYGLRPFPGLDGDPDFAWPIARALVHDGFDLTFCQELELDHGVYSWLPYLMAPPWPVKVLPIAVNMLMHPVPTPQRLRALGASLRRAIARRRRRDATWSCSRPAACRIRSTARASASRTKSGTDISSKRSSNGLDELIAIPMETDHAGRGHRGRRAQHVVHDARSAEPAARTHYSFYTLPAVTGCGVIALDEP